MNYDADAPEHLTLLAPTHMETPECGRFIASLLYNGSEKCSIVGVNLIAQLTPWIAECLNSVKTAENEDAKVGQYINYQAAWGVSWGNLRVLGPFTCALKPFTGGPNIAQGAHTWPKHPPIPPSSPLHRP